MADEKVAHWSVLTRMELMEIVKNDLTIPQFARDEKARLLEYVARNAGPLLVQVITRWADEKWEVVNVLEEEQQTRKRRRLTEEQQRRTAARVDEGQAQHRTRDVSKFLELPPDSLVKRCYRAFYEATNNRAFENAICGVCGRDLFAMDVSVRKVKLNDIPRHERLFPGSEHAKHDLYDGMLLQPEGLSTNQEGNTVVNVCEDCFGDLKSSRTTPPRLSLANNLWIGKVPWQLQILTCPEQMLIALLYPQIYVFKLHTKNATYQPDASMLQSALRGTVSTYPLDVHEASSMARGLLLPRKLAILPSVISITFIGKGKPTRSKLKSIFRVRRQNVLDALVWLKTNNEKYYGNVIIDRTIANELPEDDVPEELFGVLRQNTDTGVLEEESGGYVPHRNMDNEGAVEVCAGVNANDDDVTGNNDLPDIIPLEITGTIDNDMTRLSSNEMMLWGLANLWKEGQEGGYVVRPGRKPASDFRTRNNDNEGDGDNAENFFEKAFPCFFPYGRGGLEAQQCVEVSLGEHVKWALQYYDQRFRTHVTFPYVVFSILQRREALGSARVQMKRQTFEQDARIMANVTLSKLKIACDQEEKNLPISDPAVRLLRKHVHATISRVTGSDQQRQQLRSQIWSTCISLGPPTLWLTINPCDLHDPIAQIFAGEKIDMDQFIATNGPDRSQRAKTIASDPYAASKFFHFMIKTIIEVLFKIKVNGHRVTSEMGIVGKLSGYYCTVETQGRGTLHLHGLLWMENTPTGDEMVELLKTDEFRKRVVDYIQANLRAYLPGLETAETVKSIPVEKDIAYNRPPNPAEEDYDERLKNFELRLARTEQIHTCKLRCCLLMDSKGQMKCKRKAPFKCSDEDFITESGEWGPKRLYAYTNGWIPGVLVNARCNNDGKLLTNGKDTKNITFYVTSYAAKKQGRSYNMSAVLAKGYDYHMEHLNPDYAKQIKLQSKLMLYRLVEALNQEQEIAGLMIISYLMKFSDVYRSHTYSTIYWASFTKHLTKSYPELVSTRFDDCFLLLGNCIEIEACRYKGNLAGGTLATTDTTRSENQEGTTNMEGGSETIGEFREPQEHRAAEVENITIEFDATGHLYARCQVNDYRLRGRGLEDVNVLDFFVDTYEVNGHDEDDSHVEETQRGPGRPRHKRTPYMEGHPKAGVKQRITRAMQHRNLPNFVGQYLPRRDDEETRETYFASMLMLLKPWRDVLTDLKDHMDTWETAFERFLSTDRERLACTLSNIQYFYECQTAAQKNREGSVPAAEIDHGTDEEQNSFDLGEDVIEPLQTITEEDVQDLIGKQISDGDFAHGMAAIAFAKLVNIFPEDSDNWTTHELRTPSCATGADIQQLYDWKQQMQKDVRRLNGDDQGLTDVVLDEDEGTIERMTGGEGSDGQASVTAVTHDSLPSIDPSCLRIDQHRAYDIVTWHLQQTLGGKNPPPLRMILYGEGGTGKSKVIQTITDAFTAAGADRMLIKSAYTGVAASLINGKTTHTIGGITLRRDRSITAEAKAKLQAFWKSKQYLIIDEYSMISKSFLAKLSKNVSIGKEGSQTNKAHESFGGVNVILCGDLHQFPPVAVKANEYLYQRNDDYDPPTCILGQTIYEEFSTVVILREQMRVTDHRWRDLLTNLRYGRVTEADVNIMKSLIIGSPTCANNDFAQPPWNEAGLVTPRHAVRIPWNETATRRWCAQSGNRLFICNAEDTVNNRPATLQERYCLASQGKKDKKQRKHLPWTVELAIGMKVLVMSNLETDLDLTNGARAEITDIILHPDEEPLRDEPVTTLQHMPVYILVKMARTHATTLEGLDECVIPVEPQEQSVKINIPRLNGKPLQRTLHRRQYPITGAYAFTDYRSQGQTIPYVIVDIATPPNGGLSLFNLYVALSRSSGRSTIRLLRNFDENIFKKSHDLSLLEEDDRLENLNESTKAWWDRMTN